MKKKLDSIIPQMYHRLDLLIEYHNFDLQNSEIQEYSKILDREILLYTRNIKVKKEDASS